MPYEQYRGRSLGRILKFLYHYCGGTVAEEVHVVVGDGRTMTLHGRPFCTVAYDGCDVPTFEFLPEGADREARRYYEQNQLTMLDEILERERDQALAERPEVFADLRKRLDDLQKADEAGEWFMAMNRMRMLQEAIADLKQSLQVHRCKPPKKKGR